MNPFDNTPMEGYRPQRYWLMGRAFRRAGHEVVYWTSDFSHATKRKREFVVSVEDDIKVEMLETKPYSRNVCLSRVRSHRELAREWTRRANSKKEKPNIIIASMPPLGLCDEARKFAAHCGALFIADVQDAWPETFERILPRFVFSLLGLRRVARRIYAESDGVSAVAMRYIDLALKYGCKSPTAVFGHLIEGCGAAERQKRNDGILRLAYIGNMSLSYDLETLIKCVSDMDGITLDVAGNGPDRQRLKKLSEKLNAGCSNIRFHDYLDENQLADLLSSCDVGVIPMFPESCVGVPGKMADYAAAGLKVVECLGGETAALVDRFGVGTHYKAGDMKSLRKAIEAVKKIDNENVKDAFARNFNATEVMDGYVEWVAGVMRRKKDWGSTQTNRYQVLKKEAYSRFGCD